MVRLGGAHLHCASSRTAGRELAMSQRASPPSLLHSLAEPEAVVATSRRSGPVRAPRPLFPSTRARLSVIPALAAGRGGECAWWRRGAGLVGRRGIAGCKRGVGGRLGSCLRRNDGEGAEEQREGAGGKRQCRGGMAARKRLGCRTRRDTRGERGYDGALLRGLAELFCAGWRKFFCAGWREFSSAGWWELFCAGWRELFCAGWRKLFCAG